MQWPLTTIMILDFDVQPDHTNARQNKNERKISVSKNNFFFYIPFVLIK